MQNSREIFDPVAYHSTKLRKRDLPEGERDAFLDLKSAIDSNEQDRVVQALEAHPEWVRTAFDYYGNTVFHRSVGAFDENVLLRMLQLGAPILAPADRKLGTPFDQMQYNGKGTDDLINDLTRKLIIPAIILEAQEMPPALRPKITETRPLFFDEGEARYEHLRGLGFSCYDHLRSILFPVPTSTPQMYHNMPLDTLRQDQYVRQFFLPMRLTRTWDSHVTTMPIELTPYRTVRYWQPLLKKDFITSDGYQITCRTNSRQLNQDGIELQHCVGKSTYDIKCCAGEFRSHILSICDASGTPVSTAEVQFYPATKKFKGDVEVAGTGYRMYVRQHHGQYNGTPTREAKAAFDEFITALSNPEFTKKYFTDDPQSLGEIVEKRESNAPSIVEEYIEFTPSWEHLERIFNEFRRPERRASTHTDEKYRLIYDDVMDPDDPQGFKHSHHLIDGYVCVDNNGSRVGEIASSPRELVRDKDTRIVSLRDVGFRDWLNATGLRGKMHRHLGYAAHHNKNWATTTYETANSGWRAKLAQRLLGREKAGARELGEMNGWLDGHAHWQPESYEAAQQQHQHPEYALSGERAPLPPPRLRRRDRLAALQPTSNEPDNSYFDRNGR